MIIARRLAHNYGWRGARDGPAEENCQEYCTISGTVAGKVPYTTMGEDVHHEREIRTTTSSRTSCIFPVSGNAFNQFFQKKTTDGLMIGGRDVDQRQERGGDEESSDRASFRTRCVSTNAQSRLRVSG